MAPTHRNLAITLSAMLAAGSAAAQTRAVEGSVIDSATRLGIQGAAVSVRGTSLTAVTGTDGKFRLSGAPEGESADSACCTACAI